MKRDPISFAVVIAVTVGVLAGLNEVPRFLGGEPRGVVRYQSVQGLEARRHAVWHPAALPAPWTWPPSRIRLAVGEPDWVEFTFGHGDQALAICQALGGRATEKGRASGGGASSAPTDSRSAPTDEASERVPEDLLPAGQVLQVVDASVAGRDARLRRLLLSDGTVVHEMWWREGATRIMLRLPGSADRLPAVAHALVGQR